MCTMITHSTYVTGSGRGTSGWFSVNQANVSYDHPFHFTVEHALNIDFVNDAEGPGARVAVELTAESARALAKSILETLDRAEAEGYLETAESTASR